MSAGNDGKSIPSRRGFLAAASGLAAGVLIDRRVVAAVSPEPSDTAQIVPFFGEHQAGILPPVQTHTYFAAFDITTQKKEDLIQMLRDWTDAAALLSAGKPVGKLDGDPSAAPPDSGDALGLPPARLTITFGFGPGLFSKDGKDRFGLASQRPESLIDLPKFAGDQLLDTRTGGDLSVQACSDDPQVAFHAVRQLARLAYNAAQIRWVQSGFLPQFDGGHQTPRNLMGFKDGSNNPDTRDPKTMDKFVWAPQTDPAWMQGGSYMVIRRIRIALEHWDRMSLAFQEQTVGRTKYSGAPLGSKSEFDPANLDAADKDGNPIIPDNAHIRLAGAEMNEGSRILRRSYSYNDGVSFTSERWPPWRQGMEYDAGLLFVAYQRDPRTGFIKIFDTMSKLDMMNQFITHNGGGLFACPGGISPGQYIGQRLFDA